MSHRILSLILGPKLARVAFVLTLLFMLTPTSALAVSRHKTAAIPPVTHTFAITAADCTHSFFALEPWYQYLPDNYFNTSADNKCDLKCFNLLPMSSGTNSCGRSQSDLPLVLLAIVDDLLRIAGMVAVGFVIYGAVKYTTSQGNPDATSQAQSTVINALVGMAVAMIAVVTVSFIGDALK